MRDAIIPNLRIAAEEKAVRSLLQLPSVGRDPGPRTERVELLLYMSFRLCHPPSRCWLVRRVALCLPERPIEKIWAILLYVMIIIVVHQSELLTRVPSPGRCYRSETNPRIKRPPEMRLRWIRNVMNYPHAQLASLC